MGGPIEQPALNCYCKTNVIFACFCISLLAFISCPKAMYSGSRVKEKWFNCTLQNYKEFHIFLSANHAYPNINQSAFNKFLYETNINEKTCRNYKQGYLDFTWSNIRI